MNNPYQAPESDLGEELPEAKTKKGWKIFFWFMMVSQIYLMVSTFIEPTEDATTIDYLIDFAFYPITILGLFGYAYNKSLISLGFWKVWIWISVITDTYAISKIFDTELTSYTGLDLYLFIGVISAILIPLLVMQYFCLYHYAFRSPDIWHKASQQ